MYVLGRSKLLPYGVGRTRREGSGVIVGWFDGEGGEPCGEGAAREAERAGGK